MCRAAPGRIAGRLPTLQSPRRGTGKRAPRFGLRAVDRFRFSPPRVSGLCIIETTASRGQCNRLKRRIAIARRIRNRFNRSSHIGLHNVRWGSNSEVENHSRRVRSTPMNGDRQFDWGASPNIGRQVGRAGIYRMCIRANATTASCSDSANAHARRLPASSIAREFAAAPMLSLREESNTRSTCRLRGLITPIRTNMVGPPR